MRYYSRPSFPKLLSSSKVPSSRAFLCALGVAALSGLSAAAQAQTYTLTDLGTLGGSQSFAKDVNDSGQAVGYSLTSDGSTHGFLYNAGGSLKDLGTTVNSIDFDTGKPYITTGTNSYALGINNQGQIAGYASDVSGMGTAFVSTPNGGTLNGLNIGSNSVNAATGINDKGQVIGATDIGTFFYDPSVGASSYTALPYFYGVAINNVSEVVGNISERPEAALWEPIGGPAIGGYGFALGPGLYSPAFDINDSGQVVGSSMDVDKFSGQHAFLSAANGDAPSIDLGTLVKNFNSNADDFFSEAHGINNKDQVVGTSEVDESTPNTDHAFIWQSGVMTDLNSLIAPGSGFTLLDATAISDTGFIVGNGTDAAGLTHAFLLSPAAVPEASTTVSFGLLLVLGLGGMMVAKRKKATTASPFPT